MLDKFDQIESQLDNFSGKALHCLLLTYVNLDNRIERVMWFQRLFGTTIVEALAGAIYYMYLHRTEGDEQCEKIVTSFGKT